MVSSFETDRNEQISENSTKALTTSTPAIKTNREIACPKSINGFTPMKKAARTAFKTIEELVNQQL